MLISLDACSAGVIAFSLGKPRTACPYDPETQKLFYDCWGFGWDDAEIEELAYEQKTTN